MQFKDHQLQAERAFGLMKKETSSWRTKYIIRLHKLYKKLT